MLNKKNSIPLLIATGFLITGFLLYGSAGHDDSHITFWASYTLKEFGEIINYNGDRIEQSSSLLLTVITAFTAFILRSDVVTTGYVITMLSGAAAIVMTWVLAKRTLLYKDSYFLTLVCLATSPAFLLWNTSGMESTLAALCLLWFITQWGDLLSGKKAIRATSVATASLATLCLIAVRPEMMVIAAVLSFAFFLYRRLMGLRGSVAILVFYSTILLCICILVGFRYFYFASPMPLPVSAKVSSFSMEKLWFGFYYILRYGLANIIFIFGIIVSGIYLLRQLLHKPKPDFYLFLSACALLAYAFFILSSGGDWMQMGRFLVPVLPLAAILCVHHFQHMIKNPLLFWSLCVLILALNIYGNYTALKNESHGTPIWASYHIAPEHQQRYSVFEKYNQEHLRDMDAIDTVDSTIDALIQKDRQPITLMSGQSGMVFFYTAKKYFSHDAHNPVHFYDTRALVESSLLKCSLMNDVARSSQGLYFDFDGFFARQPALNYECNIPRPDILYDINDMTRQLPDRMAAQGYTLIHKEGGKMLDNLSALPANALPAANFVMVANDLLPDLQNTELKIIRYHEKPLVHR